MILDGQTWYTTKYFLSSQPFLRHSQIGVIVWEDLELSNPHPFEGIPE